jgi:hypothetical protein
MPSSSTTKIWTRELFDISSLDSDGEGPVIVFSIRFDLCRRNDLEENSDLVIGNESDCGYVVRAIPLYEILSPARPVHRFLCCIMR